MWDTGRTMLALNRVEAAVRIEMMARGGSERDAVGRIAAWLRAKYPKWSPLRVARHWPGLRNASVEAIIAEGARGLYGLCTGPAFTREGELRQCVCVGNVTKPASRRRLLALTPLAGDKVLSLHSEPLLRSLQIDTLQLHQQPQGGGNPSWTTELWDVRGKYELSRVLEDPTAHPEVVGRARWLRRSLPFSTGAGAGAAVGMPAAGGEQHVQTECVPAAGWHTCFACNGSVLEQRCKVRGEKALA